MRSTAAQTESLGGRFAVSLHVASKGVTSASDIVSLLMSVKSSLCIQRELT